jgi:hypothetical protein
MSYKIYISGPISGHADLNEPAFRQAAAKVAALYHAEAIVPHDLYAPDSPCRCVVWCRAMVADLDALELCDAIYFLDNWHKSTGARRELIHANAHGLRLIF